MDGAQRLELLREVLADRPEVAFAAFHAADAIGVVVAKPVHKGKFYAGAQQNGLAVVLAQAAIN
ncbi:hypothetical protein D3C80_2027440 [compost metagenome]